MRVRDPRLTLLISAAIVGAAVAFPLGVIASHQFTDVPTASTYHADIDAVRDAGITTGCAPGKYCPKDFVTREQMAAFLNRLGALQAGKTPVVNADRIDGLESGQFVRSDVPVDGRQTCSGVSMESQLSSRETRSDGGRRFFTEFGGTLLCELNIPDGATITTFTGRLSDVSAASSIACRLRRYEKVNMTGYVDLATFGTSTAYQGGAIVRNDATIAEPVVDSKAYAYVGSCFMSGGGDVIQILHLDVIYTVTAASMP